MNEFLLVIHILTQQMLKEVVSCEALKPGAVERCKEKADLVLGPGEVGPSGPRMFRDKYCRNSTQE